MSIGFLDASPQQHFVCLRGPMPTQRRGVVVGGCLKIIGGIVVLGVVAVVVLVVIAAVANHNSSSPQLVSGPTVQGSATTQAVTGSHPAAIGETVEADGLAVTIESVTPTDNPNSFTTAEVRWTYLTLDVLFTNTGTKSKDVNPLYFAAKDIDNGYTFDDNPMAENPDTALPSSKVSPGDKLRGTVVLKVRTDSKRIRIKYSTASIGGKALHWLYTA